ncbi:MAG: cytochrome c oxidase assembly protein [Dehalococcoidia bacterium]
MPWEWAPQPYVGIWAAMILLAVWYVQRVWRSPEAARRPGGSQSAAATAGWVILWVATDWPLGTLAAGYLLSASMVQLLAYYYVVAPLLVHGVPRSVRASWLERRYLGPVGFLVRRPLAAFALWNGILIITHVPLVADRLKALEVGMMAMDLAWLGSAVVFWWALDVSGSEDSVSVRFGKGVVYLLGSKAVPALLGALLTFHNFPLYETYEFANRVWPEFTALEDQEMAGLLMWEGMTPLLLLRLGLMFRAWYAAEQVGTSRGEADARQLG